MNILTTSSGRLLTCVLALWSVNRNQTDKHTTLALFLCYSAWLYYCWVHYRPAYIEWTSCYNGTSSSQSRSKRLPSELQDAPDGPRWKMKVFTFKVSFHIQWVWLQYCWAMLIPNHAPLNTIHLGIICLLTITVRRSKCDMLSNGCTI